MDTKYLVIKNALLSGTCVLFLCCVGFANAGDDPGIFDSNQCFDCSEQQLEQQSPPALKRRDLTFGYYCSMDGQISETAGHVNMYFECQWGAGTIASRIARSQLPTFLDVSNQLINWEKSRRPYPAYDREERLRQLFTELKEAGVLHHVGRGALYLLDEPDRNGFSDTDMKALQVSVRKIAAEFPDLKGVRLAVIYGAGGNYPGFDGYDIIGFDDYGSGTWVLTPGASYDQLVARLRPDQRTMLVPGGADHVGRTDPLPWLAKCQSDPRCLAVVPFIYFDDWEPGKRGIRSNGMREAYCKAGMEIAHPEADPASCFHEVPKPVLSVNGAHEVTVQVGDTLNYLWKAPSGVRWYSTWSTSSTSCGWGVSGGAWEAQTQNGSSSWPAWDTQRGCKYSITYTACAGSGCASDSITVKVE